MGGFTRIGVPYCGALDKGILVFGVHFSVKQSVSCTPDEGFCQRKTKTSAFLLITAWGLSPTPQHVNAQNPKPAHPRPSALSLNPKPQTLNPKLLHPEAVNPKP